MSCPLKEKEIAQMQKNGIFLTETVDTELEKMALEAKELYLDDNIPRLKSPPTALEFQRDWVSKNKPVIIKGVIDHWRALDLWSHQHLRNTMGDEKITVAVTPNGYADAICDDKFVMPEERSMTMHEFLDILDSPNDYSGVHYIQKQNSNLTDEFEPLADDVEPHIPWATEAFGGLPDAVNFWMGDGRAVTSLHKDHYENLYCVIKGEKVFTLLPPTDQACLPYEEYESACYREDETNPGHWQVIPAEVDEDEENKVPWIAIDPLKPDLEKYPKYANAHPMTVRLREGETLYLPSLWYHHVQQSHACIAVNLWHNEFNE